MGRAERGERGEAETRRRKKKKRGKGEEEEARKQRRRKKEKNVVNRKGKKKRLSLACQPQALSAFLTWVLGSPRLAFFLWVKRDPLNSALTKLQPDTRQ